MLIINSVIVLLTAHSLLGGATHSIASFMGALGVFLGFMFLLNFVREHVGVHEIKRR
jgi:hypothetical protein